MASPSSVLPAGKSLFSGSGSGLPMTSVFAKPANGDSFGGASISSSSSVTPGKSLFTTPTSSTLFGSVNAATKTDSSTSDVGLGINKSTVTPDKPFSGAVSGSIFGSGFGSTGQGLSAAVPKSQGPSLFQSGNNTATASVPGGVSLFGSTASASGGGVMGAASVFGSGGSVFGARSSTAAVGASPSLFGPPKDEAKPSLFGTATAAAPDTTPSFLSSGNSIFGKPGAESKPVFEGSNFKAYR